MTSYFIKFMLLLMVTLSISQANATVVYYKNTKNWQTPTAHMWNGGEGTNFPGKAMTNLGDGWYSIDAGSNKNILFNNGSDKEKTRDLQIPQNESAAAYVDGKWETVTYKILHPWGESGELTVKTLTDDGDGYYSLSEKWCDAECDVRCYISGSPVGDPYTIEKKNITLENSPQKGDVCTFTYNPADKSLTVTKGTPLPYKEVYIFGGVNVNEWDNTKNYVKMECNEGVYTYNFTYDGKNNLWAFYARRKNGTATYLVQDAEVQNAEVTPSTPQEFKEMGNRNGKVFSYSRLRAGRNYTIKLNCNDNVVSIVKNVTRSEIPVYPNGVSTESELKAYDFEANPVYYLVAQVLNDNRPTPEWQMEKGADGKYHINGFAMRNTNCIGNNNREDGVAVCQYTSANSYIDLDEQTLNNLPENPLSEGRLFNATFDPETGKLTFEEDPSANHKMPFISLVGYMMQQDAAYPTPRGVEGKPAGVTTATGWQEAWLQYDAEGNLLKDRKGNVMYSTMWPPKNPVYFTANAGGERHYSSDQMTFSPVKAAGKYVAKTGAEWERELKASDNADAYQGLDLADDSTYYRYVVDDIWYVGAGKIWTGWAGQTVNQDGKQVAQWSNHRNWGYKDKKATDTEGTSIDPETTYGVSTEEGANGNFLFKQPTFFKTIEFFYDNNDPQKASKIYTTLAYGSASIAAQSNKEDDGAYRKGSYQPSVSVLEGVNVTGYTIYRYDATTNELAPIGDDEGKVAEGTKNPNSTKFTFDNDGLADGRYYYKLTVNFSNGRSSTVRSNPFIIHHPGEYTLDAKGYQLVKFDKAVNGYEYVTYNSEKNGEMYLVNITGDAVDAYEVLASDKRDDVKALLNSNEGIKWTDKVFVYAPVPSSFKVDADKANATVSLNDITGYTLGTATVAPFNAKELVKLDSKDNFAQRTYKAVMNYKETDPNNKDVKTDKSTLGKENITMMQMPNVKAKASVVKVTKIENSEVLDIIDGEATKQKACNYYEVNLALNFDDPNVITTKAPRFKIGDKVYEGVTEGTHSLTFTCVNPLDLANVTDITVDAVYYDGTDYTLPATIGEAAVLKADKAKFQVLAYPKIEFVDAITSKMLGKHVVAVTEMHTIMNGADKISETPLDDEYYNVEFAIDDHTTPDFNQILTKEDINFKGVLENKGDYWIWSKFHVFDNTTGKDNVKFRAEVTPMYVAHVTNQTSTENLKSVASEVKPDPAESTYVALKGKLADYTINKGIATGVTDITTLAPRARKVIENGEIHIICGDRKYNVMGAEIR